MSSDRRKEDYAHIIGRRHARFSWRYATWQYFDKQANVWRNLPRRTPEPALMAKNA